MAAGSLALLTALLVLFGAYDQVSGPSAVLTLPEAGWELSLGVYLIAKGFRPNASLLTPERRDTAAHDRAFDVSRTVARDSAALAGV
jgi:hypothetical protein